MSKVNRVIKFESFQKVGKRDFEGARQTWTCVLTLNMLSSYCVYLMLKNNIWQWHGVISVSQISCLLSIFNIWFQDFKTSGSDS